MDYGLRVVAILVLAGIAWAVLSKIDPMGGKDYSGVPVKSKVIITLVLLIVGAVLLFIKST